MGPNFGLQSSVRLCGFGPNFWGTQFWGLILKLMAGRTNCPDFFSIHKGSIEIFLGNVCFEQTKTLVVK